MADTSQAQLDQLVAGMTALHLAFDGPATAYVGGTTYITLCSRGEKPQGEAQEPFQRWDDAVAAYGDQLWALLRQNHGKQLAWRFRPMLEGDVGAWSVRSRLAFI
jgi:hypothetical protein